MSVPDGWQPLSRPRPRAGADAFHLSSFARLARAHVLTAVGDALLTIALAGSLFFELDPNDARWKVFLYLGLTMAPLAIVAPFIGPVLDRSHGGRRWMIVAVNAVRAVLCLVMLDDLDSLLLFPEAFTVLAMGKAYGVARMAVVPTVVRNDAELVEANSKLQLLSGLAAPAAGLLAGPAYGIARSQGVLALAVAAYTLATLAALRIPTTQVAAAPATEAEEAELRSIGVILAASAMGLIRGIVGFLTFLLLFDLRDQETWNLGVVLGLTGAGALLGSALAPRLRAAMPEERMIIAALGFTVVVGLAAAWAGGLAASAALAAAVAIVSTSAKLAFDSIVQRDAPDANRGRSFARFEVRFQLVWVIGAMIPLLLLPIPVQAGFVAISATAAFALFSYLAGQRAAHRAHRSPPDADAEAHEEAHEEAFHDTSLAPGAEDEPDTGFADDDLVDPGDDRTFVQPPDEGEDLTFVQAPDEGEDLTFVQAPDEGEDRTFVQAPDEGEDRTFVQPPDEGDDATWQIDDPTWADHPRRD